MSFSANIPQGTDPLPQSYSQLRANFQAINGAFSHNHVGLTRDLSIAGMHNVLMLNPQSADPTTSSTQIALYSKLVSGVANLFFRPASNGTPIQMTFSSIKADGTASQYSFMAGPFIIFAGKLVFQGNGTVITLSQASTVIYSNLCTSPDPNISIPALLPWTTNSGNTFTVNFNPASLPTPKFTGYYLAVGVP